MSDGVRKIYWDSSCFICFLNEDERARGNICDDVLKHAEAGEFQIWISTWVMVEVIRPKRRGKAPLPDWAIKAIKAVPEAQAALEELWARYQRNNPAKKLTPTEIALIQAMFEWPFIKKVQVDEVIVKKAIELCHAYNLGPGDAIHAATAIQWKCDALQRWDKDYSKINHLITTEEPKFLSAQPRLIPGINQYGPNPEDFTGEKGQTDGKGKQEAVTATNDISGGGEGASKREAPSKAAEEKSQEPKA